MCAQVDLKYRSVEHSPGQYKRLIASRAVTHQGAEEQATLYRHLDRSQREYLRITPYQALAEAAFWQSIADAKSGRVS